jgi:hypothetical protein
LSTFNLQFLKWNVRHRPLIQSFFLW